MIQRAGAAPPAPGVEPRALGAVRTVPFDYVVTFPLIGRSGNVIQRVINISTVGTFAVTALSYALLVDERATPRRFGPVGIEDPDRPPSTPRPGAVVPPEPVVVISEAGSPEPGDLKIVAAPFSRVRLLVNGRAVAVEERTELDVDETGRLFLPPEILELRGSSTLVVEDLTNGVQSSPIVVTGEGSVVGGAAHFARDVPTAGSDSFDVLGVPGSNVDIEVQRPDESGELVPRLRGTIRIPRYDDPENGIEAGVLRVRLGELVPVVRPSGGLAAQAAAVASSPDDAFGLLASGDSVTATTKGLTPSIFRVAGGTAFSLASIPFGALQSGFRLDPVVADRLEGGVPVPPGELRQPFVRCGTGEGDLQFLYSITDNGTGRAFQNEPIHNIAGLGIANGDRPFRALPHPIVFEPRSVIRFEIREISGGPGVLYFVLQGYKVVGAGRLRFGFEE